VKEDQPLEFRTSILIFGRQSERVDNLRLLNQSRANHAHGHFAANDATVFDDANSAQIAFELSLGNTGGLATVTAEVLVFTALSNAVADGGLQISVQVFEFCPLNSFVFLQSAHDLVISDSGLSAAAADPAGQ